MKNFPHFKFSLERTSGNFSLSFKKVSPFFSESLFLRLFTLTNNQKVEFSKRVEVTVCGSVFSFQRHILIKESSGKLAAWFRWIKRILFFRYQIDTAGKKKEFLWKWWMTPGGNLFQYCPRYDKIMKAIFRDFQDGNIVGIVYMTILFWIRN